MIWRVHNEAGSMGKQKLPYHSWGSYHATGTSNWLLRPVWLSTAPMRWLEVGSDSFSLQDLSPCTFWVHCFLLTSVVSYVEVLRAQIFNNPIIFKDGHEGPGELCPAVNFIISLLFVTVNKGPLETGLSDTDTNVCVMRSLSFWTSLGHLVSSDFVNASVKKL